jgi:hypothetical protein
MEPSGPLQACNGTALPAIIIVFYGVLLASIVHTLSTLSSPDAISRFAPLPRLFSSRVYKYPHFQNLYQISIFQAQCFTCIASILKIR